ncbi:MAG: hypothetical protein ABJJ44_15830 [Paraglaciecola sp.]|nr:hypothetical protein [Paraglaciecola marina]
MNTLNNEKFDLIEDALLENVSGAAQEIAFCVSFCIEICFSICFND